MPQRPNSKLKVNECRLCLSRRMIVTSMPVICMSLENVLPPSNALQGLAQMTSDKVKIRAPGTE